MFNSFAFVQFVQFSAQLPPGTSVNLCLCVLSTPQEKLRVAKLNEKGVLNMKEKAAGIDRQKQKMIVLLKH